MPMCTKYGKDRHLNIVSNHSFLDALITYIPENSILLEMKEGIKKTVVQPVKLLPNNEQRGLEQCLLKMCHYLVNMLVIILNGYMLV